MTAYTAIILAVCLTFAALLYCVLLLHVGANRPGERVTWNTEAFTSTNSSSCR